ncbi:MAG: SCO family protein [Deltaproteobacteria bacterium]|nr:SCO family protein [Deltaproteobacteria bacterium]
MFIFLITPSVYAVEAAPGITEKTGASVPLDAAFRDESGNSVTLGDLLKGPMVLSFAYFGCKDQCNTVLSNLANTLGRTNGLAGKDFLVLTVSFDENDSPVDALNKKRNYMPAARRPMTDKAWRFLTGDRASIESLTGAVGYGFRKTEKGFDHPAALAVLSPDGRIIRYIYGNSYLPADIEMALLEASEGRITASIKKAILLCFSDEPGARAYFISVLRAVGVGTLVFAAGLFIYLTASGRPGKKDPR